MDHSDKRAVSRRIADPGKIDHYRNLLRAKGSKEADMREASPKKLAVMLVYVALEYYSEQDILSAEKVSLQAQNTPKTEASVPSGNNTAKKTAGTKKKTQSTRNIRAFLGKILTTLWYALQTAYTRTASTVITSWSRLKSSLTAILHRVRSSAATLISRSGWSSAFRSFAASMTRKHS